MDFFCFDIETCPLGRDAYLAKSEEERKKLLNPIDSRIIAIGISAAKGETAIFQEESEASMLEAFWREFAAFKKKHPAGKMLGFNVKDFDLPFVVTRSFINGTTITPFILKDVLDLRENISAFTYRHTRGKLKELAGLVGIKVMEGFDGENVAEAHWAGQKEKIAEYLAKDIEIIEAMAERIVKLRISEIQKW